ncbi:MAG: hypothetical protein PHX18_02135 [Candidatus Gastranaerophilales bacterium]|nr:hypothetical protein [Candidatus Gastranaerophilales bacterium]
MISNITPLKYVRHNITFNAIGNPNSIENYRASMSKTDTQKRRLDTVKEGVLINSFVKDSIANNRIDIEGNFIIPKKTHIDSAFKNNNKADSFLQNLLSNPILPLCLTAVGVLGGVALSAKVLNSAVKHNLKAPKFEQLPDLPRNMNLLSENDFVTYMAVQNPSVKNILGAMGAISFAAVVFVVKNFVDGFKDIWVKKQETNIQRNLQENLIEVETKSFAGKNNIIRNMMREKADIMNHTIEHVLRCKNDFPPVFKGFVTFGNKYNNPDEEYQTHKKRSFNALYIVLGLATLGLSAVFARKTFKYIRNIAKEMSNYNKTLHQNVDNVLREAAPESLKNNQSTLLDMFSSLNFKPDYVAEKMQKAGFEKAQIDEVVSRLKERYKVFVEAPEALGGRKGVQYYSYIDDVQGHFYNWIMNKDNAGIGKVMRNLFLALAAVSGLGYAGKTTVEGLKDIQVKKINAQTDLSLHKRLVDVELRNFEAKKRSNIDILMAEFMKTAKTTGDCDKLKVMATEILYEIKNGAPFVYS